MRLIVTAFALLLLVPAASAGSVPMGGGYGAIDAARNTDPVRLGQAFCDARITGDMTPLAPFFAPKLTAVLADAPAADVPWQSYADRPTGCTIEIINGFKDTIGVLLKVTYTAPGRNWSDTINLERTTTSWLINNVFYENGGNLRFKLFNATSG